MTALRKFCTTSKAMQAESIYAFGTSALRNAKNATELIDRVRAELHLEIEVISGDREAELIYKGVASGYDFKQPGLIMDIGGGSTEFILADGSGVVKAHSFEIGVSRIYQLFQFSDPMSPGDCEKVVQYLEQSTGDFFNDIAPGRLIGASGSFETFYKMA